LDLRKDNIILSLLKEHCNVRFKVDNQQSAKRELHREQRQESIESSARNFSDKLKYQSEYDFLKTIIPSP
jgi:hypothetical protein